MQHNSVSFCSFNCRSAKSSISEIRELCESHQFVFFLQETWLLPNELNFLSSIHSDFYAVGQSAVNISNDVLIGRPYGGTAVLYRKHLAPFVRLLDSHDSRITAVLFSSACCPVVLASVVQLFWPV